MWHWACENYHVLQFKLLFNKRTLCPQKLYNFSRIVLHFLDATLHTPSVYSHILSIMSIMKSSSFQEKLSISWDGAVFSSRWTKTQDTMDFIGQHMSLYNVWIIELNWLRSRVKQRRFEQMDCDGVSMVRQIVLLPCSNEAKKVVETLAEHRSIMWCRGICPSAIQPNTVAIKEANSPSTVAWSCQMREHLEIPTTLVRLQ